MDFGTMAGENKEKGYKCHQVWIKCRQIGCIDPSTRWRHHSTSTSIHCDIIREFFFILATSDPFYLANVGNLSKGLQWESARDKLRSECKGKRRGKRKKNIFGWQWQESIDLSCRTNKAPRVSVSTRILLSPSLVLLTAFICNAGHFTSFTSGNIHQMNYGRWRKIHFALFGEE